MGKKKVKATTKTTAEAVEPVVVKGKGQPLSKPKAETPAKAKAKAKAKAEVKPAPAEADEWYDEPVESGVPCKDPAKDPAKGSVREVAGVLQRLVKKIVPSDAGASETKVNYVFTKPLTVKAKVKGDDMAEKNVEVPQKQVPPEFVGKFDAVYSVREEEKGFAANHPWWMSLMILLLAVMSSVGLGFLFHNGNGGGIE